MYSQLPYNGQINDQMLKLTDTIDEMNHLSVAEYTPILEVKPYTVSILRDKVIATGTESTIHNKQVIIAP